MIATTYHRLIAHKLYEKRASKGRDVISVRKAAGQIGISPSTLSRIETGKSIPDLETFYLICRWLDADANDLLGLTKGTKK